jgi:hypothetical protein
VDIEYKDMMGILPPGCLFKPEKSSKILYIILDKLQNLSLGNYLLNHKAADNNVVIYEKIEVTSSYQDTSRYYDLHESHKRSPLIDIETIPYIPVRWIPRPGVVSESFPINKNVHSTILGNCL